MSHFGTLYQFIAQFRPKSNIDIGRYCFSISTGNGICFAKKLFLTCVIGSPMDRN